MTKFCIALEVRGKSLTFCKYSQCKKKFNQFSCFLENLRTFRHKLLLFRLLIILKNVTLFTLRSDGPWKLDLKMVGRIESEWAKVIHSLAEFSLRHPSQSFLSGTYSLLISEHFCGAGETLDLPLLLFVLRHLPRLISDQGQRDVQVRCQQLTALPHTHQSLA